MSAYSTAHGPEAAVDLVIANDRTALETTQSIINDTCTFTDGHWAGIAQAADRYQAFLLASPLRHNSDLAGVDLTTIDYATLVRSELQERNIENNRPQAAGL